MGSFGFLRMDINGIPRSNIEAIDKWTSFFNRKVSEIEGRSLAGLLKCAALIRNETEHGDVKTPRRTGNLINSWFVVSGRGRIIAGGGKKHRAEAGGPFSGPDGARVAGEHSAMLSDMEKRAMSNAKSNDGPVVIMGYSAFYALYVHEMHGTESGKEIHWTRKGSGPSWFYKALIKQEPNMLKIIADNVKMK